MVRESVIFSSGRVETAPSRVYRAVPGPDRLDAAADRLDGSDRFVAQDPPVRDGRDVALENVQVGTANRGGVDPRVLPSSSRARPRPHRKRNLSR